MGHGMKKVGKHCLKVHPELGNKYFKPTAVTVEQRFLYDDNIFPALLLPDMGDHPTVFKTSIA